MARQLQLQARILPNLVAAFAENGQRKANVLLASLAPVLPATPMKTNLHQGENQEENGKREELGASLLLKIAVAPQLLSLVTEGRKGRDLHPSREASPLRVKRTSPLALGTLGASAPVPLVNTGTLLNAATSKRTAIAPEASSAHIFITRLLQLLPLRRKPMLPPLKRMTNLKLRLHVILSIKV